jgi:uncharacterized protein (TIGR02996 family)
MRRISLDEAALLRTICEDPEADLPRLVYADWLEEHDRIERAEFIRWHIEVARDRETYGPDYMCREYEADFNRRFQAEWSQGLPKWRTGHEYTPRHLPKLFERGFAAKCVAIASRFVRHGEALVETHPLRFLILTHAKQFTKQLGQSRALRHIQHLGLESNNLDYSDICQLLQNDHLRNVEYLNLGHNSLSDGVINRLSETEQLPKLRVLDLIGNRLSLKGIERLANSEPLQRVKTFFLHANYWLSEERELIQKLLGSRCDLAWRPYRSFLQ